MEYRTVNTKPSRKWYAMNQEKQNHYNDEDKKRKNELLDKLAYTAFAIDLGFVVSLLCYVFWSFVIGLFK